MLDKSRLREGHFGLRVQSAVHPSWRGVVAGAEGRGHMVATARKQIGECWCFICFRLSILPPTRARGMVLVVLTWAFPLPLNLFGKHAQRPTQRCFPGGCYPVQVTIEVTNHDLFQSNQLLYSRQLEPHFKVQ